LFSLEKGRQREDLVAVYHCLMECYREDGASLFLEMHRHKLEHGKIQLDMNGKDFTMMVVKY